MRLINRWKLAAALLAFVVVSSVVISPAQALPVVPASADVESELQNAWVAADGGIAAAIAEKFAHSVVDDSQTTETSQVSVLPDGSRQLVSNTLPVRVKKAGVWVLIDTTLRLNAEGVVVPAASAVAVEFSGGGSNVLARVQTDTGKWISELWPYGDLPAPKVSGSSALYVNVLPDVDLRLTASAVGMSEVLIVHTARAAANPKLQNLQLKFVGASFSQSPTGSITASASDDSTLISSSPIWWDSSNPAAGPDGPGGDGEVRSVDQSVADKSVTLDLRSITQSGATKYPLYVDPDWSSGQQAFWFTDRAFPNVSYLNGQNSAGYLSVGAATQSGISYMSRAFWEFGTSALVGKQISNAVFSATQNYSVCGNTSNVQMYRYGPVSAGFTWNQDPGAWNQLLDEKLLPYGSSCTPASTIGMTATAGVAYVAATGGSTIQLGLRSANEASQSSRKHYAFGASLTVTYNSVPGTPAALQYTSPARTCSTDPANPTSIDATQPITLQANASDADAGQNLETNFVVSGITQPSFAWSQAALRSVAGPTSVMLPANALALGEYRWRAQTNDGVGGVSPQSSYCYLRAVTASPALPTVTKTSIGAAVVGMPMTVEFGSGANDGVNIFAYWWTVGTPGTPLAPPVLTPITPGQPLPACGSASGSVRFACRASGSLSSSTITVAPIDVQSTLWVASYNDAGRVSLSSSGQYAASGLAVSAGADLAGVSLSAGHIWDSENIASSASSVPDLNTTSGSSGSTTRQPLGGSLQLADGDFFGLPTTVLNYTTGSTVSTSERGAIDTKNSFTVSAWLLPSGTSASGVAHVAISHNSLASTAFTLGTDANGAAQFCRTSLVNQMKSCAVGPVLTAGEWTMLTGVWDSVNESLRLLMEVSIVPSAVASQPVPSGDWGATGWLCVGGSCAWESGLTTTAPWDGHVFRPAVFPGVVSAGQLGALFSVLSPNDDPPADESVGAVVNLRCDQLITPQQMYDYDPQLASLSSWTPSAGTAAARAHQWNGLACRWMRETGGVLMDISVASILDRGTMVQLQKDARLGTPVPGLGDSAYYSNQQLQIFSGTYWLVLKYPWIWTGTDFAPLGQHALANLP